MNKKLFSIFITILGLMLYSSCTEECSCMKSSGCRIVTIKLTSNDSLITRKFCSKANYYTDTIVPDSTRNFLARYQSTSTVIVNKDSLYNTDIRPHVPSADVEDFVKNGYLCPCSK